MARLVASLFAALFAQIAAAQSAPLSEKIDQYLGGEVERGFSGAVLVSMGDAVILAKGYGMADKAGSVSATSETVFDIGSLTKQFTGAAILKLTEQGKLDLQDSLGQFFNDVPQDKANITLHQLLTHTAGFKEYSGGDYKRTNKQKFLRKTFASKLKFTPGEKFEYSNVGYSLLAAVIETVSGQSYETFLAENFFGPVGMESTGYLLPSWDERVVAVGYDYALGRRWGQNVERWAKSGEVSWNLYGNGGILSTVEDLYKWRRALDDGLVLSSQSMALYEGALVDAGRDQHYGYGWRSVDDEERGKIVFHNGGNTIFFATVRDFVDADRIVVFLTNEGRRDVYRMSREIERIIDDDSYVPATIPQPTIGNRISVWFERLGL